MSGADCYIAVDLPIKTKLFDIACSKHEQSAYLCQYLPLIHSLHLEGVIEMHFD